MEYIAEPLLRTKIKKHIETLLSFEQCHLFLLFQQSTMMYNMTTYLNVPSNFHNQEGFPKNYNV